MRKNRLVAVGVVLAVVGVAALGEDIDPKVQEKIDAKVRDYQKWAADKVIVDAVKAQNAAAPKEIQEMTQDKWKGLPLTDEFVKSLAKNAVAEFLKGKKDAYVAEAFVSDSSGRKVAFLAKTSNWSHAGKPKHDDPMKNKTWQGAVELDESSGMQCVQVAVPVLDGDKPIGSLVVGINYTKIKKE
jgi:hypothetical protein